MTSPSPLRAALLAPYRAGFYLFLVARRTYAALRPGHSWRTWVTPEVMVGGFLLPSDVAELSRLGIGAVVNTTCELIDPVDALIAADIEYLNIPCWDMRAPTTEDADRAVAFIAARVAEGKRVYVHCGSGVGRSVAIVVCFLVTHRGMAPAEALSWIKEKRPRVSLSDVQRRFVETYATTRTSDRARER